MTRTSALRTLLIAPLLLATPVLAAAPAQAGGLAAGFAVGE